MNQELPNTDELNQKELENLNNLLEKYDNLINHLDYKNYLYYAALFQQLFTDFETNEEDGPIKKSLDDLSKILQKACDKLNFDIQNANMKQLFKLYTLLIEKLGGSKKIRQLDPDTMETLLYRMYSDTEMLELLEELEYSKINPENIVGINENDEIVFTNDKTYKISPSSKFSELTIFYAEMNNNKKKTQS